MPKNDKKPVLTKEQKAAEYLVESNKFTPIANSHKKAVTKKLIENTLSDITEASAVNNSGSANIAKFDPILMPLLRRVVPNLVAFDICGVQPMSGPTGLIFSMRSRYVADADEELTDEAEALFNEAISSYSGTGTHAETDPFDANYESGEGFSTQALERLGRPDETAIAQMGFTIDKVTVEAKGRALKAEFTNEIEQDLKAIHNLSAKAELAKILSTELVTEINREVVRDVFTIAKVGAQDATVAGTFDLDTDADGRWVGEKVKGLLYQIEKEANEIARSTRRGKGNILICSSNVASALNMVGVLDNTPALGQTLKVDDTGNTFVGILNGKMKVFIDPFLDTGTAEFACVGYRGETAYDAGYFYAPYTPLQMAEAIGQDDFQPRIAFRTRYGKVANPFATDAGDGAIASANNFYYRKFKITNL